MMIRGTTGGVDTVSLRDVLPGCRIYGGDDIRVSTCCHDSRGCKPGDLFAAIVGPQRDGHEFVSHAIEQGAAAILAERPLALRVPTCVVDDTRDAYGHLRHRLANNPSDILSVVGITGTHGKTSTGVLVASVLKAAGLDVGIQGSLGCNDGVQVTSATDESQPGPDELAAWLSRTHKNGCSHAVAELSSRTLAKHDAAGTQLATAIITNLRRRHLDFHGSILNYHRAKSRIVKLLDSDGVAVLNADDKDSRSLLSRLDCPVMTVGIHHQAEVTATVIESLPNEQTFLISAGSETVPVSTQMIGQHHIYNCLCAAAVGLLNGIDLATIARGLESIDYIPGRLQRIECGQPFGVYVDGARTPDRMAVALQTIRRVTSGRLICVYGSLGEQDGDNRPRLGRIVEKHANLAVITNDNPRSERPSAIAHDILDGYERPGRDHVLPNRERAIEWALSEARPGDAVLIAGKGCEDHQTVDGQIFPFDDAQVAQTCLRETPIHHDEWSIDN